MSRCSTILVLTRQVKRAEFLPGAITINIEPNRIPALIKFEVLFGHRTQIKTNLGMQQGFAEITVGVVPEIKIRLHRKRFEKDGGAHEQSVEVLAAAAAVREIDDQRVAVDGHGLQIETVQLQ